MSLIKKILLLVLAFCTLQAQAVEVKSGLALEDGGIRSAAINKKGVLHLITQGEEALNLAALNPKTDEVSRTSLLKFKEDFFELLFSKRRTNGYILSDNKIGILRGRKNRLKKLRTHETDEVTPERFTALDEKNKRLFVVDSFSTLSVFNSKNLKPIKTIDLNIASSITLDEENGRLYISDSNENLNILDTKSLEIVDSIDLTTKGVSVDQNNTVVLTDLIYEPNKNRIYFTLSQGTPSFGCYELNADQVIPINITDGQGNPPELISFTPTPNGDRVFIQTCGIREDSNDEILVFDASSETITERFTSLLPITDPIFNCPTQFFFGKNNKIYEVSIGDNKIVLLEDN